jgi:branched-chain amino acid transport system substrate-binding protein
VNRYRGLGAALLLVIALTAGCGEKLDEQTLTAALAPTAVQDASAADVASRGADSQRSGANLSAATAAKAPAALAADTGSSTGNSPVAAPGARTAGAPAVASVASSASVAAPRSAPRSTLVFGNVGTYNGLVGAVENGNKYALSAWVSMQNARGGLDGHPIKLIIGDDGGDPVTGLTLMKRMVENDHVMAFVGNLNIFGLDQYADYAGSKGIPFIGGDGSDPRWYSDPNLFPSTTHGTLSLVAGLEYFVAQGATRLGMMYCLEVAKLCAYTANVIAKSPVGKYLVVNEQVSLVAPSYTSQCLRMQSAKVEVAFLLMDTAAAARLVQHCATQNYHPKIMLFGQVATPDLPTIDALRDALIPAGTVAPSETQVPAVTEFNAAMARYAPGIGVSGTASLGWAGGMILGRAGAHLPDNPTAADLIANLWKLKNDDLGGYTTPLTFAKNMPAVSTNCMFAWGVKDRKFSAPLGPQRRC